MTLFGLQELAGLAVIGHSCCSVPANVLSVWLFVCFVFFLAKLIKENIVVAYWR